jgi:hypothetical protein
MNDRVGGWLSRARRSLGGAHVGLFDHVGDDVSGEVLVGARFHFGLLVTSMRAACGVPILGFRSAARLGAGGQNVGMVMRFVYLAFCAALRRFARRRAEFERDAELLALRHEVAVLVAGRRGRGCVGEIERSSRRSLGCFRRSAVLG